MSLINICSSLSLSLSLSLSVSENLDFCENHYYWNLEYDTWCSRMCLNCKYNYIECLIQIYRGFIQTSKYIYKKFTDIITWPSFSMKKRTLSIHKLQIKNCIFLKQCVHVCYKISLLFKRHMPMMTKEMICISISTFILKFALNSGMTI